MINQLIYQFKYQKWYFFWVPSISGNKCESPDSNPYSDSSFNPQSVQKLNGFVNGLDGYVEGNLYCECDCDCEDDISYEDDFPYEDNLPYEDDLSLPDEIPKQL